VSSVLSVVKFFNLAQNFTTESTEEEKTYNGTSFSIMSLNYEMSNEFLYFLIHKKRVKIAFLNDFF
jgi:hypothetical protein